MGLSAPSGSISRRSLPLSSLALGSRPLRRAASDVGTLLSLLCFRRGVAKYYPRPTRLNCILHLTRLVWFARGESSLILPADRPFAAGIEPMRRFRQQLLGLASPPPQA